MSFFCLHVAEQGQTCFFYNRVPVYDFSFLFPLPFALLCAVLFLRGAPEGHRVIFVVPLMMATWYVAQFLASAILGLYPVGGLIGGIALVLSTSLCCPKLYSEEFILSGAIIGTVSSFTFFPYFDRYERIFDQGYGSRPVFAFALWQALMGAYLFAVCTHFSARELDESGALEETSVHRITP